MENKKNINVKLVYDINNGNGIVEEYTIGCKVDVDGLKTQDKNECINLMVNHAREFMSAINNMSFSDILNIKNELNNPIMDFNQVVEIESKIEKVEITEDNEDEEKTRKFQKVIAKSFMDRFYCPTEYKINSMLADISNGKLANLLVLRFITRNNNSVYIISKTNNGKSILDLMSIVDDNFDNKFFHSRGIGTDTPYMYTLSHVAKVNFSNLPSDMQVEILCCANNGLAVLPGYGTKSVINDTVFFRSGIFF